MDAAQEFCPPADPMHTIEAESSRSLPSEVATNSCGMSKTRLLGSTVTPPPPGEERKRISESLLLYVLLMRNKCRQDIEDTALFATKMHRT